MKNFNSSYYSSPTLLQTKYFALGNYEEEIDETSGISTKYYYISGGNGLAAIYKQQGSAAGNMYYVHKDHLGSIMGLYNSNGALEEEFSYDAWGRRRDPKNWNYITANPSNIITRGYTEHEHLDDYALINMRGRIYDPVLGRFLSPDKYVQEPGFSQSFNRYGYCRNNPLKYTDPSGEFVVVDSWLIGFVHGFFSTGSGRWSAAWHGANLRANNDAKIWGGLLASDPNKSFSGRVWEITSRLTWQLPQSIGGFTTAHAYNTFGFGGGVESVKYKYGATVVKTRNYWGGVTQGSYIVGDKSIKADPNNPLFQHEYGHYIQSQSMGFAYYGRVGIPSIMSKGDHDFHPVEQDANRRAFLYFNKNVEGFQDDASRWDNRGWNFLFNPLDVNKTGTGEYINYSNPNERSRLNSLRAHAKWYDYTFLIVSGFYNAWQYNR